MTPLLDVKNLSTCFHTSHGIGTAVRNISFSVMKGEILGIAGESGSGKTATAFSILRLYSGRSVVVNADYIMYNNQDLLQISAEKLRKIRGCEVSMIFQDPSSFLNPVFSVRSQLLHSLRAHSRLSADEIEAISLNSLKQAGISHASEILNCYPHQLSGGMAQRVMIAIATATKPCLLIADEPATSLDVTLQSQIIDLLLRIRNEQGNSIVLITHDLNVLCSVADRIHVMYGGDIVEKITACDFFINACHPYTRGLINSMPDVSFRNPELKTIPGNIPDIFHYPEGCRFSSRCTEAMDICRNRIPPESEISPDHRIRCWLMEKKVK